MKVKQKMIVVSVGRMTANTKVSNKSKTFFLAELLEIHLKDQLLYMKKKREQSFEDKATTCFQLLSNACDLEEIEDEVLFANILIEPFKSL